MKNATIEGRWLSSSQARQCLALIHPLINNVISPELVYTLGKLIISGKSLAIDFNKIRTWVPHVNPNQFN